MNECLYNNDDIVEAPMYNGYCNVINVERNFNDCENATWLTIKHSLLIAWTLPH